MASERAMKLKRGAVPGNWRSEDGRWLFLRHHSDPHPQRWYAFLDEGGEYDPAQPANDGMGHTTLREVVAWASAQGSQR